MAERTAFFFGAPVEHLQSGSHCSPVVDVQHESLFVCEVSQQQADDFELLQQEHDWQHCEEPVELQQQVANNEEGNAKTKQVIAIVM